ncbi:MAG: PAS domain S-box protein [Calditerrivibrio sp.]|nr:PAS domain S-box protein [Calditerrivibrio sp.]
MEKYILLDFIESASDVILSVNDCGIIEYWNCSAEILFGFKKDEAIGMSLDIIIPEKHREKHWESFYKVIETGKSKYKKGDILSVPAIDKNGNRISIEFTITTIDISGKIKYIFSIIRNKSR